MNEKTDTTDAVYQKLSDFLITQQKCFIRLKPSTSYPKGKFYNGTIIDVTASTVTIHDDVEGHALLFFSEIASPTDIERSTRI